MRASIVKSSNNSLSRSKAPDRLLSKVLVGPLDPPDLEVPMDHPIIRILKGGKGALMVYIDATEQQINQDF